MMQKFEKTNHDPIKPDNQDLFHWHLEFGDYVECPCCGTRHNQIYKRRIYGSMLKGLKRLAEHNNSLTPASIGDFAKLRFWGLIKAGGQEGAWEITQSGRDFLAGLISIPEFLFIQNNQVVGRSETFIYIGDIQ